jgi:type III secretion HrpO family protein
MFQTQLVQLAYQALLMILLLSAPPVLISLVFGLVVAIFQAATQIQEQTLASTIKLVAVTLVLMLMGGWLGGQILNFSAQIFEHFYLWGQR